MKEASHYKRKHLQIVIVYKLKAKVLKVKYLASTYTHS